MKKQLLLFVLVTGTLTLKSYAQANTTLSNLVSPVAVNQHILPNADNLIDLGSAARSWRNVYLDSAVYLKNILSIFSKANGSFFAGPTAGNLAQSGINNSGFGQFSLSRLTTGAANTGLGNNSLASTTTGSYNIAAGSFSLYINTAGNYNTAQGYAALTSNTTGSFNTGVGSRALNSTNSGSNNSAIGYRALYNNTTGNSNVGIGFLSMYNNTTGSNLVAVGDSSMFANTTGTANTAVGTKVMSLNTTGSHNTGMGYQALQQNTTGVENTAMGEWALQYNSTGYDNTAIGRWAMIGNTEGRYNTGVGDRAVRDNTTGEFNSGVGSYALGQVRTGMRNSAIGADALSGVVFGNYNSACGGSTGYNADSYSSFLGYFSRASVYGVNNVTAIGYSAVATASNQVMLGNTSVTSVMAAGSYVIYSDGRFKKEIKENVPGLDFVNQLRPVTYHYDIHGLNKRISPELKEDLEHQNNSLGQKHEAERLQHDEIAMNEKEKIQYTGFVAQEVEAAAKKLNYDFSGVYKPQNDKDVYGLSYSEFVVPLVKAVQQLSEANDALKQQNISLEIRLEKLETLLKVNAPVNATLDGASLEQNIPNPFGTSTTIYYMLPRNISKGQIVITNVDGKKLKTINVNGVGRGNLNLDARSLSAGTYYYSLNVDGKMIDSKQLVIMR